MTEVKAGTDEEIEEVVVVLSNVDGAELALVFPAAIGEREHGIDYVRFTRNGVEESYWHVDEWTEDPEGVMGAIMGAIAEYSIPLMYKIHWTDPS